MKNIMVKVASIILLVPLITGLAIVSAASGNIKIDPPYHLMTVGPIEYHVYTTGAHTAYNPHIFLAISKDCWEGLTEVKIEWSGGSISFSPGDFASEDQNSKKLPLGKDLPVYTVASLKDHLGTDDEIYWVFDEFLDGTPITNTYQAFNVTLDSNEPNMMIYVIGSSTEGGDLDTFTPVTPSGFVVPEPATIATIGASMVGLSALSIRRMRKK